jgi:hypothetical protein
VICVKAYQSRLEWLSLCYLTAPWLCYLWGWRAWPLAAFGTLLLLAGCNALRNRAVIEGNREDIFYLHPAVIALTGLAALVMTHFSLPFGVITAPDSAFHALTVKTWPLAPETVQELFFSPGTAIWLLPAASIAKTAGPGAGRIALEIWIAGGVVLSLLWVHRLVRSCSPLVPLLFLLFAPLHIAGVFLFKGVFAPHDAWAQPFWSGAAAWHFNTMPHACITAWITLAVLLHAGAVRRFSGLAIFIPALAALIAPGTAAGLLPFAAIVLFRGRGFVSAANLIAAPWMAYTAYALHRNSAFAAARDLTWPDLIPETLLSRGILFLLLSFGFYALFLHGRFPDRMNRPPFRVWWRLALILLVLVLPFSALPEKRIDVHNAALPALTVFVLFFCGWLSTVKRIGTTRERILLLLILGMAFSSLFPLWQHWPLRLDTRAALPAFTEPVRETRRLTTQGDVIPGEGALTVRAHAAAGEMDSITLRHDYRDTVSHGLVVRQGTRPLLELAPPGDAVFPGTVWVQEGAVEAGNPETGAGILHLQDGGPGKPGYISMQSPDGTRWYFYFSEQGGLTLQRESDLRQAPETGSETAENITTPE